MTPKAELASILLAQDVSAWIADRRASGRTWRDVCTDFEVATNGRMRIVPETARAWGLGDHRTGRLSA